MAEQLGPYLLETRIGSGGMADVFLARGPSGVCVVKRPHPHLCANPEFVRMFLDEASVLAQLHHPSIAHIFDLGQSGGVYYLAMEYVPGFDLMTISLEHERQGEFMAADLAAKVIADAAGALDYAHKAVGANGQPLRLIHRDVTPHNILVSTSGEVKVIDFGVARAAKSMHQTAAGLVKGKYPYMAPEQITGQLIDHRVDIYALGLVLYELLTNARAIAGELEFEQIDNARSARIKPVEQLRPNVPGPLKQILSQALHPQPAGRYQNAAQMQAELLNYLRTERHVVGREDLVRLFRVVAAEAAHQLPTFGPGKVPVAGDLSIRETMPAPDQQIEDTLPPPGSGINPIPSPQPAGRHDTYPSQANSNPRAKMSDAAHNSRTDKSAAHQPPQPPPDPSSRPTDAMARVEVQLGGAAAPPIMSPEPIPLVQMTEHPTYPGLPPPTKLIPSGVAKGMGLSPLDSSFRRTIVNTKKTPWALIVFVIAAVIGAGGVAWLYLKPAPEVVIPPKQIEPPPVNTVKIETPDAAVAVAPEPADAAVAVVEAVDAGSAAPEVTASDTGTVTFTIQPAVTLLIGGKDMGKTGSGPVQLNLPNGPQLVTYVFDDGYRKQERIVVSASTPKTVKLSFEKVHFQLTAQPSFGKLIIDGRNIPVRLGLAETDLWEGEHRAIASFEKFSIPKNFSVKKGGPSTLDFNFFTEAK
ncbi:MAG: serine/threonine-protein kinase [Myxococcaceae bacterium]